MTILPQHAAYLSARGVSVDAAQGAGYRSVTDPAELRVLGFTQSQADCAPVLLLPLHDPSGEVVGYQARPDNPRTLRSGDKTRALKFETPKGQPNRVSFPLQAISLLADRSVPLLIAEGPVKALSAAVNLGVPCATLTGVWNWVGRQAGAESATVLPDWRELDLAGRDVYIVFDSDIATNPSVSKAATDLARYLQSSRKAEVRFVVLPSTSGGDKQGLDDWIAAGGTLAGLSGLLVSELPSSSSRRSRGEVASDLGIASCDADLAAAWWSSGAHERFGYDPIESVWIAFNGRHWVSGKAAHHELKVSVREYLNSVRRQVESCIESAVDRKERESLVGLASSLGSSNKAQSVISECGLLSCATIDRAVHLSPAPGKYKWAAANGTIDLRTGGLGEHDSDDRLTGMSPVMYDPSARAPMFERFLEEVQPNPEIRAYLRRLCGMAALQDVGEQSVHVLHGSGANGKSLFLRIISEVFGQHYSAPAPHGTLIEGGGSEHPTQLMTYRGRRLMLFEETGREAKLDAEKVKMLSGGGLVTARAMHSDFVTFAPSHTLILATNFTPEVGTDLAMWRRLRIVPFAVTIPAHRQDPTLQNKIVESELSGVLNWIVEGAQEYLRLGGLMAPSVLSTALSEWKENDDSLGVFIAEHCERGDGRMDKPSDLYAKYREHLLEDGAQFKDIPSAQAFNKDLRNRGFDLRKGVRGPKGKTGYFIGIQLKGDSTSVGGSDMVVGENPF